MDEYFSSPIIPSSRNDENLHGIWNQILKLPILWITTSTTQSKVNSAQTHLDTC